MVKQPREYGRFASVDALTRFRASCRFDPVTGCVLWTGATSAGQGNTARYGKFWFEGRSWSAHRWAAQFIHGIDITGTTVGHCCKPRPNTLCVQHLQAQTLAENVAERNTRYAAEQSNDERQHWLFVSLGIHEPEPEPKPVEGGVPFYVEPGWLKGESSSDDCPF